MGSALGFFGQLLKQPVALGDVAGLRRFQAAQAELGLARVVAALFQRGDDLVLPGDLLLLAMEADLGVPWEDVFESIEAEPLAAGTLVQLRVLAVDGRRGGALLDAAIEVEVTEVSAPAATLLRSWEELGLRALGGQVRYRTTVIPPPGRVVLDLGEVRGTADVVVNVEPHGGGEHLRQSRGVEPGHRHAGHGVYPIIDDADPYGVGSSGPAIQAGTSLEPGRSRLLPFPY